MDNGKGDPLHRPTGRQLLNFTKGAKFELQVKSQANAAVVLGVRSVTRDGMSGYKHTTLATGAIATSVFPVSDIPLFVTVKDDTASFKQGDCYVTLSLLFNGEVVAELAAGLVYTQKGLSYPVNNSNDIHPGRGRIKRLANGDPAPGAESTFTVPVGRVYRILQAFHHFTASTNGTSRIPFIRVDNLNTDTVFRIFAEAAIGTTPDVDVSWGIFGTVYNPSTGDAVINNLPHDFYCIEGDTINFGVVNDLGDDDIGFVFMTIEELLEVPN